MKLTGCIAALALAASPVAADSPDAAHLALARQVTALAFQGANFTGGSVRVADTMTKLVGAQVMFDEAAAQPDSDATPPPEPKFNTAVLHASFGLGIGQIAPRYQDAVATAYAGAFTDPQLRAMLAFFSSPGGQSAIASRKTFAEREAAMPADDPTDAPKKAALAYVETSAERAFDASPVGQVVKQHQDAIGKQVTQSMTVLWPEAMQAAQADYCRRQPCGAPEHKVFAGLAKVWDQIAVGAGH